MSSEIFPKIGDILVFNGEKHVLFDTNVNIPAFEDGKSYFKVGYYFIKESDIHDLHVTERELHKKCITIYRKRDEGFKIECKTDEKYSIKPCMSLIFKKKNKQSK